MKKIFVIIIIFLLFITLYPPKGFSQKEGIETKYKILTQVLRYIRDNYVEEKDIGEVLENGIDRMVKDLDPYSDLLTPKEWKELEISTRGKFGGIGIQVDIRENFPTVISPIEGTPAYRANLRPGDKIIEVNGESTEGWTIEKTVNTLRGEPGTEVNLKIRRAGIQEPFDVKIIREIIEVKPIALAEIFEKDIGYLRITNFSENLKAEVISALDSLKNKGMKKIIIDLRYNPGGLLNQAVELCDIFLEKDKEIVFTKGRTEGILERYKAIEDNGIYEKMPLVVLINKGSASASEIFAGAIQDHDRGIIIGDTSFGKASVQRIFPLDAGYKLKLTTAFYHLPSGRLIHKKDKLLDIQKFKTLHLKREVLGGIGIIPEIIIREREFSTFSQTLSLKNYFFNFATEYYNRTGKSEVTEEVLEEFWKYILSKEKNLERENFEKAKEEIRMLIDIELSEKKKGIKGRYEALLKYDNVFKKAIEILKKAEKRDDVFSSK
uniref:S41 family peptidase n=1 Tax=candidate division WOR-3 bacterium TaxID=2052148 RepID=A0A7V4E392_UNCW3